MWYTTYDYPSKEVPCLGKRMKKNGFVEGAVAAYAAIIVTKLLGALYGIPFYGIIGDTGGIIYSCAYNVYSLLLDISTSGIPVAMSILISEYSARGQYYTEKRAYRLGLQLIGILSLLAFAVLQLFAPQIERFFLADMTEGVAVGDIETAIRVMAFCLLIVPFLSLRRGYLQGHKFIAVASQSQVIEQVVRIAVVLASSYVAIRVLQLGTVTGVCFALSGAAVGAAAALLYLQVKSRRSAALFHTGECTETHAAPRSVILRRIFSCCLTIVIVSMANSIYNLVDMKMLLLGLHRIGFTDEATQTIASVASTWIPKISMILVALPLGLTSSIAPHMAESYAAGDRKGVNRKFNQALGTLFLLLLPLSVGMILFAEPIYRVFYGSSPYGASILQFSAVINVIGSVGTVASMTLQSVNRGKAVCFYTVIGLAANAALDLPFIYLFQWLGWPAYLGASFSSVLGQALTAWLLLRFMKRQLRFTFRPAVRTFLRSFLPTLAMLAVVWPLHAVWPPVETRGLALVAQLAVDALCGAAVYLPLAYKTGAVRDVFGSDALQKLRHRLTGR